MRVLATVIVLLALITTAAAQKRTVSNWPSFRGDHAAGIADGANLPEQWDAEKGVNIKWKARIQWTQRFAGCR